MPEQSTEILVDDPAAMASSASLIQEGIVQRLEEAFSNLTRGTDVPAFPRSVMGRPWGVYLPKTTVGAPVKDLQDEIFDRIIEKTPDLDTYTEYAFALQNLPRGPYTMVAPSANPIMLVVLLFVWRSNEDQDVVDARAEDRDARHPFSGPILDSIARYHF